jgi:hypothetical protein
VAYERRVPSISGNAALDVLIGLFFMFFLLSIVCSSINEAIAAVLSLRARFLERGIWKLLDGETNAKEFYEHWRIQALTRPAGRVLGRVRKPSYLPSRTFALTLLDKYAPAAAGHATMVQRAKHAVTTKSEQLPPTVRGILSDALTEAHGREERLRASIERSFDDVMDRASGWYKRRIQLILFVIAVALVAAFNADTFAIGQRLWKDDALRAAAVAQADRAVVAGGAACKSTTTPGSTPVDVVTTCVNEVRALQIPLGWSHDTSPHSFAGGLGKIAGLLVTAFALTLGAPFWFDLLGKVSRLRGSGPPASGSTPPPPAEPAPASAADK